MNTEERTHLQQVAEDVNKVLMWAEVDVDQMDDEAARDPSDQMAVRKAAASRGTLDRFKSVFKDLHGLADMDKVIKWAEFEVKQMEDEAATSTDPQSRTEAAVARATLDRVKELFKDLPGFAEVVAKLWIGCDHFIPSSGDTEEVNTK